MVADIMNRCISCGKKVYMAPEFRPSKFKLWYSHQVPGLSYEQEVPDARTGQMILDAIYQVALYQFDNKMIPDYCNAGGIVYLDEDGEWTDYDPEEWG